LHPVKAPRLAAALTAVAASVFIGVHLWFQPEGSLVIDATKSAN